MADYGWTVDGYVAKPTAVWLDELIARARTDSWPGADLGVKTMLGGLIGIVADVAGQVSDELQAVVAAADPDAAEDAALDVIASYQLVLREGPRPSEVTITATGVPGTPVPNDANVAVPAADVVYRVPLGGTIAAVPAWFATTAVTGDRRHNGGVVYECQVGGVTGVTGPSGAGTGIVDGAAQWMSIGAGTGAVDLQAFSVEDGPIVGAARTLTEIVAPVLGWDGVINLEDAIPGQVRQSNESLRITREAELAAAGDSTPDGIRANLLRFGAGIRSVTVFSNRTDVVDGDGVPGHSVEALVTGGDEQTIAEILYRSVADGVGFAGAITRTVEDSEGGTELVSFSRAEDVSAYVAITVQRDAARFDAATGADEIKRLLIAYGDAQRTGDDLSAFTLAAQVAPRVDGGAIREAVPGVTGVVSVGVGLAPSPTGTTLAISRRQRYDLDSARIAVVLVSPT